MKTRLLTLLAVPAVVLSLVLGSCSGTVTDESSGSSSDSSSVSPAVPSETEAETEPLETYDLGGFTFMMYSPSPESMTWANPVLNVTEQTGEVLNDAIYQRNRGLEERANILIAEEYGGWDIGAQTLRTITASGDNSYHIVSMIDRFALQALSEHTILSYVDLPHIDLTKSCWGGNMLKDSSIGGVSYFAFGDFSLYAVDNITALLFNQRLADTYQLEDLYDLVESGNWTLDRFEKLCSEVTNDLDGDGLMTESDQWGYLSMPKQVLPSFWIAGGASSITKDENDLPVLNMNDEHFTELIERAFALTWDSGAWYPNTIDNDNSTELEKMFTDNHALFHDSTFNKIVRLREMDSDFGIIPYPKASDEQKEYRTRVSGALIATVPVNTAEADHTGLILELLAEDSERIVIPAYYNVAMKGKYTRDSQSGRMLDLIYSTRAYDLGDTFWCDQIRDEFIKSMMTNNDRNLASNVKRSEKMIKKNIQNIVEKITESNP